MEAAAPEPLLGRALPSADAATPPTSPMSRPADKEIARVAPTRRPGVKYVCHSSTSPASSQGKLMSLLLTRDHGWEEWPTELHTCERITAMCEPLPVFPRPAELFRVHLDSD